MRPKIKIDFEFKIEPITRVWNPNLAFKYRTTAEHKRRLHSFHKFKNYKERTGNPVRFYGDPLASDEINFLRGALKQRDDPWGRLQPLLTLIDPADGAEE